MVKESPLGQKTVYIQTYTPELLYPIPRTLARDKIGMVGMLPFDGVDVWTGYELSWLNPKGKPEIAMAEFSFPCTSSHIVESKSFKLYLNSFNQSHFESLEHVQEIMRKDLADSAASPVAVHLFPLSSLKNLTLEEFSGFCLDTVEIETTVYEVNKHFLTTTAIPTQETVYTDLFKSNCLATGQPDWGSVLIHYAGPKIDHAGLLKYLISFRNHSGFAEHCIEQIYHDILMQCHPEKLTVYGRYTRRGGLDINPFRSNFEKCPVNIRQYRQ